MVLARIGGMTILRRLLSSSSFPLPSSSSAAAVASASSSLTPSPSNCLYVSGLNKRTTSEKLKDAFSKFGQVVEARVVVDRVYGHSKGFGFVTYQTVEEAQQGIKGMDGQFLDGWVIFAEHARSQPRGAINSSTPNSPNTSY